MIDQHSRWPEEIPLRSLSAKATCDTLKEIFIRKGIPNVIASDIGTNFTSRLAKKFTKRFDCIPRSLVLDMQRRMDSRRGITIY
ncbi:gag-Pol polyprotein [Nephila pilipes]|uniref:Gag-Pol polyprotein n=1 Tax=Nephila pilipes TaxID=299642 RepID=A0A8X6JQD6_NEPPI|nr:gag-Pol polyprotein [Nephila pilipes]